MTETIDIAISLYAWFASEFSCIIPWLLIIPVCKLLSAPARTSRGTVRKESSTPTVLPPGWNWIPLTGTGSAVEPTGIIVYGNGRTMADAPPCQAPENMIREIIQDRLRVRAAGGRTSYR